VADSAARSMVRKVLACRKLEGLLCLRSFHPSVPENSRKGVGMEESSDGRQSKLTKTSLVDWLRSVTVL
jgi:hypothetical protein